MRKLFLSKTKTIKDRVKFFLQITEEYNIGNELGMFVIRCIDD